MARLVILMFCVFSITTGEFVVAGILPEVAGDLGITVGTAGLLVTAYAVGMIIGGPVLTALTAAVDRHRLMLLLLTVAVVGNFASALAPTFAVLLAARVLTALVTSTFFAQAIVVAVRSGPPERAASTVAKLAFGMNLAMILGAPIGTGIGNQWGWRATFIAIAAACLLGLVLVSRIIPKARNVQARTSAVAELRVLRERPVLLALTVTAVLQARVMAAATDAPTLAMAVNASGYQVAAAAAGIAGGLLVDSSAGARPIYLVAAALTLCGLAISAVATRNRRGVTKLEAVG